MRLLRTLFMLAVIVATIAPISFGADKVDNKKPPEPSITDRLWKNTNFSIFLSAIRAAGLESQLQKSGPYTVFAPTNSAFDKLPKGTMENLFKPENQAQLTQLILSHIVSGRASSTELMNGRMSDAESLSGTEISIKRDKNGVDINGARLTVPDMDAANGVVHGINQVLMPGEKKAVDTTSGGSSDNSKSPEKDKPTDKKSSDKAKSDKGG